MEKRERRRSVGMMVMDGPRLNSGKKRRRRRKRHAQD